MSLFKSIAVFLVMVFAFSLIPVSAQNDIDTMVSVIKGQVHLKNKAELKVLETSKAEPVNIGYNITVQDDSRGLLKYSDGTKLNLAPATELTMAIGGVKIKRGRSWMYFSKQKKRFVIQTPSAVMGILGTTLDVEIKKDNSTMLTVFSGKVSIKTSREEKIIKAGESARAYADGKINTLPASAVLQKEWDEQKKLVEPVGLAPETKDIGIGFIPADDSLYDTAGDSKDNFNTNFKDNKSTSVSASESDKKSDSQQEEPFKETVTDILGDINNDSSVDTLDVERIRLHIAGKTVIPFDQIKKADINGDGTVDRRDMMVLDYKAKRIGDFNNDGIVDDDDLLEIQDAADRESEAPIYDINGDGIVNDADIHYFKRIRRELGVFQN